MSSTNRTPLGLSQWIRNDSPMMEDFNNDNALIDGLISDHNADDVRHVTNEERDGWSNRLWLQLYYGNGIGDQVVDITCSFEPSVCIVFPINMTPGISDFANSYHNNYFGFATTVGSSAGLSLSGNRLTVTHSTNSLYDYEYRSYNQRGITFAVIALR